nr:hypothetical protein [Chromobacterium sp. ASV5]
MTLLTLPRGKHAGLHIRPRWPSRHVRVDSQALATLQTVQAQLPPEIDLILTRGFEAAPGGLGRARVGFRAIGARLFRWCYPRRAAEIGEIFGSNGHDVDGTHLDVSFRLHGRRVRLLPLGVFTPPRWQQHRRRRYGPALEQVQAALLTHGFRLHANATESLQIHCDWKSGR